MSLGVDPKKKKKAVFFLFYYIIILFYYYFIVFLILREQNVKRKKRTDRREETKERKSRESFTITFRPHLNCVILTTSLIYAIYILCHICLFPCNMLVLGFCVFIHTFCIFNLFTFNSRF